MGLHHEHVVRQPTLDADPGPLILRAVVLPGTEPQDLWIDHGVVVEGPIADATDITPTTSRGYGYVVPGLVDAHCHIGLDANGEVDRATSEGQALKDRDAGALLLRDAGSPADTRWIDEREDLPKIIRAGRHLARPKRYIRNFAEEIEPGELVAAVERQAARGDGWIKLVGDWIDRSSGDLGPLWPVEAATAAISRAHELGVRVTAHVFGEQALEELLDAGIDGIEHGSGLTDHTIEKMAANHVALVPTMVQLENFPAFAEAGEAKFPRYAAHIRDLYARRWDTYGRACEAGVPMFAGTDAGGQLPHGLIGDEIVQLAKIGGAEFALGAGSWRAREWLGRPGLAVGDPADLVVYAEDPRERISAVKHPEVVILRGRRVLRG